MITVYSKLCNIRPRRNEEGAQLTERVPFLDLPPTSQILEAQPVSL